jgi:2-iminobutanoate/2-iminopropanoate deaminase
MILRVLGKRKVYPFAVVRPRGASSPDLFVHLRADPAVHHDTKMNYPTPVQVPNLPPQNETYSQAVRLGDVIYLSGQLGITPDKTLPASFGDEVKRAIENVKTVLEAAGSALSLVARVNIYITDFSRLQEMNMVYGEYFPHRPAKTTVEISRLDKGARIEIEVVAAVGS